MHLYRRVPICQACGVHDGAITKAQDVVLRFPRGANHASEATLGVGVVVGVHCGVCRLFLRDEIL